MRCVLGGAGRGLPRRGPSRASTTCRGCRLQGGHVFLSAGGLHCASAERYDASAAALSRTCPRRRAAARLGPRVRGGPAALRSLLHWRMGSNPPDAEADATAALALRDEVQGAQAYLPLRAQRARLRPAIDRGTAGAAAPGAGELLLRHPALGRPVATPRPWRRAAGCGRCSGTPQAGLAEVLACGPRELALGRQTPRRRVACDGLRDPRCAMGGPRAGAGAGGGRARAGATGGYSAAPPGHRPAAPRARGAEDERRLALLPGGASPERLPGGARARPRADRPGDGAGARGPRKEEGRELLTAGQQPAAERPGAVPLVEKAHAELVASGARPRRSYVGAPRRAHAERAARGRDGGGRV